MLDFARDAHVYQKNGAAHLWNSSAHDGVATLWLDPGYGKTTIVLHAFKALYDAGIVRNMLIVAPLRVAQTVWAQEIEEWSSLNGLVACRLHGSKKEKWLDRKDVNIWIVNYEGIPWFVKMCVAGRVPYIDVLCFDEIRRMKNAQGKRFKAARPLAAMAKFKWGLTGTPASNGLMDLFGQFLILDQGDALGKFITKFRAAYFEQGYDGFTWIPRPGSQDLIEERVAKYVYRADGFLDLPEFVDDKRVVPLPPKALATYRKMKKDLIVEMQEAGEKITASNAAVLYGKLKQMAGGSVYDENGDTLHVHEAKAEALVDLVEELGGEQLLIAYEYNHELEQIRKVLGKDIPYLGSGVNEKTALAHVDGWNRGEIQFMAAHPASAGHGLNLQKGGAHHLLWWGPTIDLDFYIQFNRRLLRQGNKSSHVVVHTFVAENTVDESVIVSRVEKDGLQTALLGALTAEFGDNIVSEKATQTEDFNMDLQFKSDANQQAFAAQAAQQAAPNPFAGQPAAQPAANPFAGQPTQQAAPNPFAAAQPAAPVQQPAPDAPNPFAATAPVPAEHAAPANPFAAGAPAPTGTPAPTQQQAIQQDVAAPPVSQPDPASAPPNPFAQNAGVAGFQQGQAPVAPVVEDAVVVQETPPKPVEATSAEPQKDESYAGPQTEVPAAVPANAPEPAAPPAGIWVPVSLSVPADKLEKVMAAIGRALK